jgi:hypothetical protein
MIEVLGEAFNINGQTFNTSTDEIKLSITEDEVSVYP